MDVPSIASFNFFGASLLECSSFGGIAVAVDGPAIYRLGCSRIRKPPASQSSVATKALPPERAYGDLRKLPSRAKDRSLSETGRNLALWGRTANRGGICLFSPLVSL